MDESADEDVSLLCAPQPPDELLLEVLSWRTNEDGNDDDEDENNEDGNDDADDYEGGNVDEPIDMIIIDIVDVVDMIIIGIVEIIIVDIVDMIIIDIVDIIIVDIVDMNIIDIVDMTRWNGTSMGSSCASCQIAQMAQIAATWSVLFFKRSSSYPQFWAVDHNVHNCHRHVTFIV